MLPLLALALAAPPEPVVLEKDGRTLAVTVPTGPLIHTAQMIFPDSGDAATQTRLVLGALREAGGGGNRLVKLNVYAATQEAADAAAAVLRSERVSAATTVVVGTLEMRGSLVAADGVFFSTGGKAAPPQIGLYRGHATATLPAGPRIYVSGQAEKGATPAEATRKTLASLKKTLEWLGGSMDDVVQAKSFLKPIGAASEVVKEFEAAFGKGKVPPLVFVEWESTLPIEIELIATGRPPKGGVPGPIEFLTPPGMTASPVYARVTRVFAEKTIYVAGLHATKAGTGGEEVVGVFDQLSSILDQTGSDFRHLAKATYYVSADDASRKLNDLRPKYYDPKRPPAASKAVVPGVGAKGRTFTLDMIAVPK